MKPEDAEQAGQRRLDGATRMECKICWHVYDPAQGDDSAQVPAGTPFLDLPEYWRCPECDAEPNAFLPIED